ncbi:energy transducer TonB [Filimonas effusa]|uniref:TonB family protein n=1 Tax=Filimonas effusa TaxID=2508721 RepID=A0A4Q1D505_9BACT|nr:energy transducer TonB [Filimonas effusa]RXK83428.1 TonB family protein [Filimonas effusa]
MKSLFAVLLVLWGSALFAQNDTVYRYNLNPKPTSGKDSIASIDKLVKEGNGWHLFQYRYSDNVLIHDKTLTDSSAKTPMMDGVFRIYYESGRLKDSAIYERGNMVLLYHYYKSGPLMAVVHFDKKGDFVAVEGIDSIGRPIPDFIYQQQATFNGGDKAWREYLAASLVKNQPRAYKKGAIGGDVVIDFSVDKQGHITDVRVSSSSGYPELDEHALNIVRNGPDWNPAIQYNQPVIYRQRQKLTYAN